MMRRGRPQAPTLQSAHWPAPMGGLNAISAGSAMPISDCLRLYNLVPSEYGLRSRLGSREWVTGLTGAADNYVRTLLPFTGSAKNGANDKLFAVTSSGIWDVTASTETPVLSLAFGLTTGDAGHGHSTVMVTAAGHFLLYCDEVNGYHVYAENSGSWTAVTMGGGATQVSGVNPAGFVHVHVHKNRVWFTEKDTGNAWYLAAGAIYGAATSLNMGRQFKAGGPLVGLYGWTYDGGSGIDDSLVGISNGGDVVIWQGTDPASASDFSLRGVWQVGPPPAGRDLTASVGGDVWILTRFGLLPISQLVVGNTFERSQLPTAKVANLFNAAMLSKASKKGWAMRLHPEDGTLVLMVPTNDGQATEQFAYSLTAKSWSQYRDLAIYSSAVLGGKFYYGTVDGKVGINDDYIDGRTLADPNSYTAVQWALLTSFQNLGNARQKQVQMLRPTFITEGAAPTYNAQARYRYDFTELSTVTEGSTSGDLWDSAQWDAAIWAGDYQPTQNVTGTVGMGVDVAIAIRGTSITRTVFVGTDVFFTTGGLL
jgi:hypothetical protein